MANNRIGDILVDLGYLTADRLGQAGRDGGRDGKRLGEHLCELGYIRQDDLTHALAVQCNISDIDLADIEISRKVLQSIPANLAQ